MKVVVFGPKLKKKLVRQYKNTNAFVECGVAVSLSKANPGKEKYGEYHDRDTSEKELTHDDESDGEHGESHKLNRLSSPRIDEQERNPVSRDKASGGEDQISNTNVLQVEVRARTSLGCCTTKTNSLQDDTGVEPKPVVGNLSIQPINVLLTKTAVSTHIKGEPRV
jgi:hypothetical protein